MTDKIYIRSATQKDIDRLKILLCKENHEEAWAINHICGGCSLQLSFDDSTKSYIIFYKDRPVLAFGFVKKEEPDYTQIIPWLMASYDLKHVMLFAIHKLKTIIDEINSIYDKAIFENFVDCRHVKMIKFIKLCGFRFDKAVMIGKEQKYFQRFWIEDID